MLDKCKTVQRTKNVECQHHRNKNILLKKAHIWLVHLLPRCVWSKPSVFKLVLKRHITKTKKMKNVIVNDKSWQLKCQYWSAFDQAGQRGLVVVVNLTITIIFFIFVNFNIIINYCHPHSHPPLQYWCEWLSLRQDQAGQGGLVVVVNLTAPSAAFSSFSSTQWAPSSSTSKSSSKLLSS